MKFFTHGATDISQRSASWNDAPNVFSSYIIEYNTKPSGGKYRVYEQQVNSKLIDLTVEHYSNVILTSNTGLYKLTIS